MSKRVLSQFLSVTLRGGISGTLLIMSGNLECLTRHMRHTVGNKGGGEAHVPERYAILKSMLKDIMVACLYGIDWIAKTDKSDICEKSG